MDKMELEITDLYTYNYGMGTIGFYVRGANVDEVVDMYPYFRPMTQTLLERMKLGQSAWDLVSYVLPRDQSKLTSLHGSIRIGRTEGKVMSLPDRKMDNRTDVQLADGSEVRSNISADVQVGDELSFSIFNSIDGRVYYVTTEWVERNRDRRGHNR